MCVNSEMWNCLDCPVLDKEIMDAFNQMDPRKASGIDVLSGMLYKENWDAVGTDLVRFCSKVLNDDRSMNDINDTIIILIPKVTEPEDMSQFRSISLCRVLYKIISKVWANRLKKSFLSV